MPIVLNELKTESSIIEYLENDNKSRGKVTFGLFDAVAPIPSQNALPLEATSSNVMDLLSQKLAKRLAMAQKNENKDGATMNNNDNNTINMEEDSISDIMAKFPTTKRRIDRLDILGSPRFRNRRNAMGNVLESLDIAKVRATFLPQTSPLTLDDTIQSIPQLSPRQQCRDIGTSTAMAI